MRFEKDDKGWPLIMVPENVRDVALARRAIERETREELSNGAVAILEVPMDLMSSSRALLGIWRMARVAAAQKGEDLPALHQRIPSKDLKKVINLAHAHLDALVQMPE